VKHTIPTASVAMPSHPAAAALAPYEDKNKKIHAKDIIDAEDQLAAIHDLVQAAFDLARETHAPLQTVLLVIMEKVDALKIVLAEVCACEKAVGKMSGVDPDPIFAAIERHREALAAMESTVWRADCVGPEGQPRIVTGADERAVKAADCGEVKALRELLATPPITSEGARAAMKYLIDLDAADWTAPAVAGKFLPALMKSALLAA